MLTVEFQLETTTITKDKRKGLSPLRTLTTILHTITKGISYAIPTLHYRPIKVPYL
jgi:hypothetical protein